MKEQAKLAERTTMPAAGLAGKRIAPNVAADGETRIIREPGADPSDRRLSPERAQEVRKYTTSKEAQYYVLKQTQENLAWLRTQHRKSQPPSAMGMKSKKDQFNHLHNKSMLTRPMRPTVKPVEPKRVYDSGKLKARPATGCSKLSGHRKQGESAKTLSGGGVGSEEHLLVTQHGVNYAALGPGASRVINMRPNSLHRYARRGDQRMHQSSQSSVATEPWGADTRNAGSMASQERAPLWPHGGIRVGPPGISERTEHETVQQALSPLGGDAGGEDTPYHAGGSGLGYSFGRLHEHADSGAGPLQSLARRGHSDADLSAAGKGRDSGMPTGMLSKGQIAVVIRNDVHNIPGGGFQFRKFMVKSGSQPGE